MPSDQLRGLFYLLRIQSFHNFITKNLSYGKPHPRIEYDIFISYRQKDNKHDGWVTEFVNQLKGELEANFKEDISIYFDENPSDGLLEKLTVLIRAWKAN